MIWVIVIVAGNISCAKSISWSCYGKVTPTYGIRGISFMGIDTFLMLSLLFWLYLITIAQKYFCETEKGREGAQYLR
jgi:hypothetical protein